MPDESIEQLFATALRLQVAGRAADARDFCRRILEREPNHTPSWHLLGAAAASQGDLAAAAAAFANAIELEPSNDSYQFHLGMTRERQQNLAEAIVNYQRAVQLRPDHATAWNRLGNALRLAGRVPEAVAALREAACRAAPGHPDFADIHNNYAIALSIYGDNRQAAAEALAAVSGRPDSIPYRANYARVLQNAHRHSEAIEQLRVIVAAQPEDVDTQNNLANSLHVLGHVDEAIGHYRAALQLHPDAAGTFSNLLYALQFSPATTSDVIRVEHHEWRKTFERPAISRRRPLTNDRDPDRRLRIGYVSADLREHAVGFFIEPVLAHHNRGQFEVFCYSDALRNDATSNRMRRTVSHWIESRQLTDDELAERIHRDGIDLLVDLSVHTQGNRLRAFALKPAPVQLSYLGYCGTSGLQSMDYRITDDVVDPVGLTERWSTESLLRLPRTFCCFAPSPMSPPVGPLPAQKNRRITFGAFNSLPKTTPAMIELWCRILHAASDTRLLMVRQGIGEESVRRELLARFAAHGIAPDRLDLAEGVGLREFFDLLNRVDIALDTFPFNGHTTTCHALWMGVPTVSLSGESPVSRVGASLLRHARLTHLATSTPDEYVKAAVDLAGHAGELAAIRKSLRIKIKHSPLCDGVAFMHDLEQSYRVAWKHWCASS